MSDSRSVAAIFRRNIANIYNVRCVSRASLSYARRHTRTDPCKGPPKEYSEIAAIDHGSDRVYVSRASAQK